MPVAAGRDVFHSDELRVEGRVKVTGAAQYAADASRPGMLFAAFVSSPVPHARITAIDARAARSVPGVRAVLTGADIGERYLGRALFDWPVLAIDVVRFVGQHVVAIAADTPEIAETAARLVEVRFSELPAIFDTEAALAPDAPILHERAERYPFIVPGKRRPVPHPNIQGYEQQVHGDVDGAFATAKYIFEHRFATPRYFGGYLEPRATLVWIDERDIVHVISTNKSPFALRQQLSISIGIPVESIVVEPAFVGGDFGAKGFSVDEFVCYYLARATGRPVKAVRTYVDDMRSTNVRHAADIWLQTALTGDGRIAAMRGRIVFNGGAYAAAKPGQNVLPTHGPSIPYRVPCAAFEMMSVYTNTVPAGHLRAPGEPQTLFAIESHFDMMAREIGDDPLAFRLRNALDEPRVVGVLEALRRESRWEEPLAPGRGRGVAMSMRHTGGGATGVKLIAQADGNIVLVTGLADQGGGALTAVQRVIGAELGLPLERIRLVQGGTDAAEKDPGAGGSRATHIVGNAALRAVAQLRDALSRHGWDGSSASWNAALSALASRGASREFTASYDSRENETESHTYSGFAVEVSVDVETGSVRVDDVLFVGDVGTVINPVAHRGQIDGGFVFGLGHALTEELVVQDGRIANPSLADYKLPAMPDLPPFRVVLMTGVPGPGPFGANSAGELSNSAVAPAIANAVAAACGARATILPITSERVLALLAERDRTQV